MRSEARNSQRARRRRAVWKRWQAEPVALPVVIAPQCCRRARRSDGVRSHSPSRASARMRSTSPATVTNVYVDGGRAGDERERGDAFAESAVGLNRVWHDLLTGYSVVTQW